jgi:prepilin-type N-terminal cleavage/methylation domain-containing protein
LRPFHNDHKNKSGFTLIELMVVMLLISIMLAVAIPRFEGGFLQNPIKKFSRKIISTVRMLRSAAIQTQKQHTLIIDITNQRLYVVNEAMDPHSSSSASEKAFKLPDSIEFIDVQFPQSDRISAGTAEIHFYPAGYSDYALIRLEDSDGARYSYVVQPLLPKVKFFEQWIEF